MFVVNMLFVMMLMLDCLVCVYGLRVEDTSGYQNCITTPAGCTYLRLNGMALTGTIPTTVGRLTSLTELYLYSNDLTGPMPTELGLLTRLIDLTMDSNDLTGTMPTQLGRLTSVTAITVNNNAGLCGALVSVGTVGTSYTWGIAGTALGTACSERVEDQSNYRTCIRNPAGCTRLILWNLGYSGYLPTELGTLTELTDLGLYDNAITGVLPTELGRLTALENVEMSENDITGTLPTELGRLTRLTKMALRDNSLIGTMPTELGRMTRMSSLDLYNNAGLCGDIVSVGTVGTTYRTDGTALGTDCSWIVQAQAVTPPASLAARPTAVWTLLLATTMLAALLLA